MQMINIRELEQWVDRKITEKEIIEKQLVEKQESIKQSLELVTELIETKRIIMAVSQDTSSQFKEYVEALVTSAIVSVFPEKNYRFIVNSEIKSNRSEMNLLIQQGDREPYVPREEQGGALLDIVSFCLRVVLWSLELPRSSNTLILDEPMRFCGALTPLAANFMKTISHELGIQLIIVTHDNQLSTLADASWRVERSDRDSTVSLIEKEDDEVPVKTNIIKRRK
jgi:hypothetical protein